MVHSKYLGNDNYGNPKSDYILKLQAMTNEELRHTCSERIWFSAYASTNPRSDCHWQCDACYDECQRRHTEYIYKEEHAKLVREAKGY